VSLARGIDAHPFDLDRSLVSRPSVDRLLVDRPIAADGDDPPFSVRSADRSDEKLPTVQVRLGNPPEVTVEFRVERDRRVPECPLVNPPDGVLVRRLVAPDG
jgi:hypothetical protein